MGIATSSSYSAEYQTVYDSWTEKPSDAVAANMNTLVEADVADGLWAKDDVYYNMAVHTNANGEAQTNWNNPGTYDFTLVNAPAFVAFEGFMGDGISAYIDYNFNLDTHGVNYTLNSGAVCAYARVAAANTGYLFGARTGNRTWLAPDAGSTSKVGVNGGNINGTVMGTDGMFFVTRYNASNFKVFRNKVEIQDISSAAAALPNTNLLGLCYSLSGTPTLFSNNQLSMLAVGANATQANVNNRTDNYETYMDSNGKGVIT